MPLSLITGPANAAKAGAVLAAFRAALPREPLLVVPTAADVEHYQRELAGDGIVFGGEVVTFARLVDLIAERAGLAPQAPPPAPVAARSPAPATWAASASSPAGAASPAPAPPSSAPVPRPLGRVARERVVRAAIADVRLVRLARSAESPGFAVAAARLFAELQRSTVTPARFAQAMRAWADEAPGHAGEVAALYAAYRRRLEALGRMDAEGFAWAALDALRSRPERWPGRPVFFYGFDDLTPAEIDAVETLARVAGADVTVALAYEAGRAAFAGRAATVEALRPLADRHDALPDRSEHYARPARPALHHLERRLFEDAPGAPQPPNGAVRLLESGGERAEAELVGAAILELLQAGVAAPEIAVVLRSPGESAPLIEQVFGAYGIPVTRDGDAPLGATRLGGGLLAYARAALGGEAGDVLTWLRTPGKLAQAELADALEARVRRAEARTAAEARRLWEKVQRRAAEARDDRHAPSPFDDRAPSGDVFSALDDLAAAAAGGDVPAVLAVLERELEAIWTAPHRRRAAVLDAEGLADAGVAAAVRSALGELRALHAADPALVPDAAAVVEALTGVRVREGGGAGAGVLLSDPLAIRARRFRAVFVCGLQDGAFPLRPGPEPFLDDDERRSLARAAGIRLPFHEDVLARERSLFYACVSRPEEVLYLSWRSSDEEGNPLHPSAFLADVRGLFTDELWERRGRRLLADVTWPPAFAPTPHELRRAQAAAAPAADDPPALAPPAAARVLAQLAARGAEPARGLETFTACGVRWLVELLLRPRPIEPDPEPMRRGSLAHAVLERTLRGLRERTGSARIEPSRLPAAEAELAAAIRELAGTPAGARARAALRGLELDLRRVLRTEAESGNTLEPARLEWSFGGEGAEHPALALAGGEVAVTGRVDRIDAAAAGRAVVRDYKNRTVHAGARWAEEGRLQVALYALAARELLGLQPAGAVYQPLGGPDLRPRGVVREGEDGDWVGNDLLGDDAFEGALAAASEAAVEAARELRAGRIRPCPGSCTPRGCGYPTICRAAP